MSTEARRAALPPLPTAPPRAETPGDAAVSPEAPPRPAAPPRPTRAPEEGGGDGGGSDAASGAGTPGQRPVPVPGGDWADPPAAAETATGTTPRPPHPTTPLTPAPPPPRASARFPDTPPVVGRQLPGGTGAAQGRGSVGGTGMPQGRGPVGGPQAPQSHEPPSDTTVPSSRGAAPGADAPQPRQVGPGLAMPRPRETRTGTGTGTGVHAPPPRRPHRVPAETPSETTTRLRVIPAEPEKTHPATPRRPEPGPAPTGMPSEPASTPRPASAPPVAPDPALSWNAPGDGRPRVSFGVPEGYDGAARPRSLGRRPRPQVVAAAVCLVLGVGLITGAVTGSWLAGDSGDGGARSAYTEAGELWRSVPVDQLFPPTVQGQGAGPGGADRTWTRVAVAPDGDCAGAFDPLLAKALAPVGCHRLLRATYTDATRSHVTTVGLLFTEGDPAAQTSLAKRFEKEGLGRRSDLMPLPYAAQGTAADGFGARQRASWTVSVLTDAPVVVYAVSGWADGRGVDDPEPAEEATESGATSAAAQAGLGHEAKGLADRVERALRKHVGTPTEHPS